MKLRDLQEKFRELTRRARLDKRVPRRLRKQWLAAHLSLRTSDAGRELRRCSASDFIRLANSFKKRASEAERKFTRFKKIMALLCNSSRITFYLLYLLCGIGSWWVIFNVLTIFLKITLFDFLNTDYGAPIVTLLREYNYLHIVEKLVLYSPIVTLLREYNYLHIVEKLVLYSVTLSSILIVLLPVLKMSACAMIVSCGFNLFTTIFVSLLGDRFLLDGLDLYGFSFRETLFLLTVVIVKCVMFFAFFGCVFATLKRDSAEEDSLVSDFQKMLSTIWQEFLGQLKKLWEALLKLKPSFIEDRLYFFLRYGFRYSSMSGIAAASEQHGLGLLAVRLSMIAQWPLHTSMQAVSSDHGDRRSAVTAS